MKRLSNVTALEGKYNLRTKYYPSEDGSMIPAEEMLCSEFIFNPDGLESQEPICKTKKGGNDEENKERSRARAKAKLFDLIMSNQFRYFVTLTLSPEEIDRTDYKAVMKRLNTYLGNRVRRNGLVYVGVPELHKKGGFHFHFLMNEALPLVPSGTYLRPSGGKPVKLSTLRRLGVDVEKCKVVYNVCDWSLGFTTAIELDGSRGAVANYVGKYITKTAEKVGGRWYYSGGDLKRPFFTFSRVLVDDFEADYSFDTPLGKIAVRRFKLDSEFTFSGK